MSGPGMATRPTEGTRRGAEAHGEVTMRDAPDLTHPRVAYQGEPGAYGEDAIELHWAGRALPIPAHGFGDVLEMVVDGRADCAVLPIWNSSIGEIETATSTLRQRSRELSVINRVQVPVRHCLLALPGTALGDVRHVGSHPAALAQCTRLFASHPAMAWHVAHDTAGAARELAALHVAAGAIWARGEGEGRIEGRSWNTEWSQAVASAPSDQLAVIASARTASRYGLSILIQDVHDDPGNATRFAVVAQRGGRRW